MSNLSEEEYNEWIRNLQKLKKDELIWIIEEYHSRIEYANKELDKKDKVIDLLDKYKNEHFIPKAEIQKLLEE